MNQLIEKTLNLDLYTLPHLAHLSGLLQKSSMEISFMYLATAYEKN